MTSVARRWMIGGLMVVVLLAVILTSGVNHDSEPSGEVATDGGATTQSSSPGTAPGPSHPSLAAIMERWDARLSELGQVTPEDGDHHVTEFMRGVPWDDIAWLCCEGQEGVASDSLGILRSIVEHRLRSDYPPLELMAAMIESHDCLQACRWPLLEWELVHHDSLGVADRERLALAYLRGGADRELPIQVRRRLLTGAASMSNADTLLAAMMNSARSTVRDDVRLGLHMLGATADPRAPDSLAALLADFHATGSPHLDSALRQCHADCAQRSCELLIDIYRASSDAKRRRLVFFALARAARPEAARVILDAYDDGGEIADSTFALPEETRRPYYDLWLATRIAEPQLIEWLRDGPTDQAELAVELIDRALRFGPPIAGEELVAALAAWEGRALAPARERARAVHARAMSPPPLR